MRSEIPMLPIKSGNFASDMWLLFLTNYHLACGSRKKISRGGGGMEKGSTDIEVDLRGYQDFYKFRY